jgi:hypothetical protein
MDKRLSMDPTMLQQMKSMLGPGGRGGPAPRGGRGGSTQPHQPSGLGSSNSAIGPGGPPGRGRGGIRGLFLFLPLRPPPSLQGLRSFCRFHFCPPPDEAVLYDLFIYFLKIEVARTVI